MINALDIETFNDDNKKVIPYCICFLFKKKNYNFYYDSSDLILKSLDLIFSLSFKEETIYIHNINFDGILIINSLSKQNKYIFDLFIKDLNIYGIFIFYKNKKIIFKCSYKLLPASLESIAISFKLSEKMIFPHKFSNLLNLNYVGDTPNLNYFNNQEERDLFIKENDVFNFKEKSISYCTNDVIITSKFVFFLLSLIKEYKINTKSVYSAPSLALKIFIKNFNFNKIKINNSLLNDRLIRPAYYGGRCEVYGNPIKGEHMFHYDFSGMYGQCMKEKFCFGSHKIILEDFDLKKPGFYCIQFSSNMKIPVLPHHNIFNKKLMFTNGVMEGVYWFEEIILFLENGGIINKILYGVIYDNYDFIFNDFVDYFSKIREKGETYKIFGKLMINSLYGRFGMSNTNEHSFFIKKNDFEIYNKKIKIINYTELNDIILVKAEINDNLKKIVNINLKKVKNNINIASAITAKARIKLYKAQKDVEKNGGRLYYSDTDSIFAGYKLDVSNEKHGEIYWDNNKKDTKYKDAVFIAPKTYGIRYENLDIIKNKGFTQNLINFDEFKDNFYKNKDLKIYNLLYISKKKLELKIENINKNVNLNLYDKRKFSEDKKYTFPFAYENYKYS